MTEMRAINLNSHFEVRIEYHGYLKHKKIKYDKNNWVS